MYVICQLWLTEYLAVPCILLPGSVKAELKDCVSKEEKCAIWLEYRICELYIFSSLLLYSRWIIIINISLAD